MPLRSLENVLDDLSASSKILGINISGNKTIFVYGDMNGLIYERMHQETLAERPFLESFDTLCSQTDKVLKICRAQGLSSPEVISVAVSGDLDVSKGVLLSSPDLPLWEDAQLKGRLGVRYNLPVFVEQRSNAAALAEFYFGAGIGVQDLLFLDLEPVVATGIIMQGSLYRGANDAAGEIGRMRMAEGGPAGLGEVGSLTGFASGAGMAELASIRYPNRWPTPPMPYELVKAVNAGEEPALAVVAESADHLGRALLWLIFTLDPDMVIFGHPGDVLGEALLTPLRDAVLRYGGGEARQLPRLALSKLAGRLDDVAALMAIIDPYRQRKHGRN